MTMTEMILINTRKTTMITKTTSILTLHQLSDTLKIKMNLIENPQKINMKKRKSQRRKERGVT
jgi:hypothetical protein